MSARYPGIFVVTVLVAIAAQAGPPPPCAPVPPGLVGWWRLEGNANDATGQHNGSVTGGAFTAGEVNQGFAPGAIGTGVVVSDDPALNPTTFTLDAWARIDVLPPINVALIWKGNPGGADVTSPFGLGVYGVLGGPPAVAGLPFLTMGTGVTEQELDGPTLAPIGSWFHLAATADGTTVSLYLNGQLVGQAPQTVTPAASAFPLQIACVTGNGARNPGPTAIDEVEIHNRAATAAQILAIYVAGSAGKCPDIIPVQPNTWGAVKARYSH